ncbi:MAG: ABC transporter permease [Candidatus Omnitrophota bacterium]
MGEMIKELIQYRELLMALSWRNITIRYKQTIMGFMWALFMPALIVLSGVVVQQAMSVISGKPLQFTQIASVAVKSLPWAFFVGTLKMAVNSLVGNMNLVTKIYFPREMFPFSAVISQLYDFAIAGIVLAVILFFAGVGASIYILWLPVLLLFLVLFTTGLSLVLASSNLFFRDVKYIVDVILTFGIFFTPVFYSASMFGKWKTLLLLNPMGAILEGINDVVILHQAPDPAWILYAAVWSVGGFFLAWWIFHKTEPAFAENI